MADLNMSRIKIIWTKIWDLIKEHFKYVLYCNIGWMSWKYLNIDVCNRLIEIIECEIFKKRRNEPFLGLKRFFIAILINLLKCLTKLTWN